MQKEDDGLMGAQDLLMIPAVIFAIAIAGPSIWGAASDFMGQMGVNFNVLGFTTAGEIANTTAGLYFTWDYAFLILSIGMLLSVIISSYFIDSHPAFFFITLIVFLISMTISPLLSNVYNGFIGNYSGFDASLKLPLTTFILEHYPLYLLGMFAGTGIALYAKFARGAE